MGRLRISPSYYHDVAFDAGGIWGVSEPGRKKQSSTRRRGGAEENAEEDKVKT
jgi:hypothetical protein